MTKRAAGEANVRQKPNGRWEARRTIGSREAARTFSASGATRKESLANLNAKVAEDRRRQDLDAAADWTVAQFLDWWVAEELAARVSDRTLAPTTRDGYELDVRRHLGPRLGKVKLADFTALHVRRLMSSLEAAGLSANHRSRLHTTLSGALTTAVRYGYVDRANPVSLVPAPTVSRPRRAKRSVDDVRKLLAAAEGTRLEAYWRVMLSAPLRPGEPRGADWDAFDLDAGVYRLRRNLVRNKGQWLWHPTKGKRERDVPLAAPVVSALREHRRAMATERLSVGTGWRGAELVDVDGSIVRPWLTFTYPDGSPVHATWMARELQRLCGVAKIERVTPHGLRHLAVTQLQARGVDPRVVQQLAGHTALAVTDLYTGKLDEEMRAAVNGLAADFQG